jgi:hypothetical protein
MGLAVHRSFSGAGAAEAADSVESNPADAANWELPKLQLLKALKEDEPFREELPALLPKQVKDRVSQAATVTGTGNAVVQNTGSGSTNVQR